MNDALGEPDEYAKHWASCVRCILNKPCLERSILFFLADPRVNGVDPSYEQYWADRE